MPRGPARARILVPAIRARDRSRRRGAPPEFRSRGSHTDKTLAPFCGTEVSIVRSGSGRRRKLRPLPTGFFVTGTDTGVGNIGGLCACHAFASSGTSTIGIKPSRRERKWSAGPTETPWSGLSPVRAPGEGGERPMPSSRTIAPHLGQRSLAVAPGRDRKRLRQAYEGDLCSRRDSVRV